MHIELLCNHSLYIFFGKAQKGDDREVRVGEENVNLKKRLSLLSLKNKKDDHLDITFKEPLKLRLCIQCQRSRLQAARGLRRISVSG